MDMYWSLMNGETLQVLLVLTVLHHFISVFSFLCF